jgi:hypothetical protein
MALLSLERAPHGGSQRHLPEWRSQPKITPTTIIDHSIVGTGEGAWWLFAQRSTLESHFIICGAGDRADGYIWQLMDTDRQADANLQANGYAISIETGDKGDPDRQPWTPNQLRSLIWLHAELRRVHPTIPNRRSRSCADPAGHGYHTLHGAPSCWTPVSKTCPGTVRKRQWAETLLPAYLADPKEDDDMTGEEHRALLAIEADADWLRKNATRLRDEGVRMTAHGNPEVAANRTVNNLANVLTQIAEVQSQLLAGLAATGARLDAIEDLLTPEPEPTP